MMGVDYIRESVEQAVSLTGGFFEQTALEKRVVILEEREKMHTSAINGLWKELFATNGETYYAGNYTEYFGQRVHTRIANLEVKATIALTPPVLDLETIQAEVAALRDQVNRKNPAWGAF